MREPHTKGSHVLSAVKVLRANRERALALLPPALHKYLQERILASSWYPLAEHLELLRAIAQLWPSTGGDPWMLMGRATAQADLNGLYKIHLKTGDPSRTLVSMSTLWRSAHDTGETSVILDGERAAELVLREFPLRSRDFCRVTTGYVSEVIVLAGGRDGDVTHPRCRGEGAVECCWQASWS